MVKIATRRVGQRRFRRPAFLVAIGVTMSLGIAGAVAGAAMLGTASRDLTGRSLSLRVAPWTQTVAPGDSATYLVRVEAGRASPKERGGRTRLSTRGRIPTGSTVSITPRSTVVARGPSHLASKLTIQTTTAAAPGTYRFQVQARRPGRQGRTTVTLTVSAPDAATVPTPTPAAPTAPAQGPPVTSPPEVTAPDAFTISGTLPGLLEPGSEAPLDLSLSNLEGTDLSITGLTVSVASVSAPRSDALRPCSSADFSVAQFSGTPGFTLPASSTATLGELGFGPAEWPQVTMLDSAANQDGCKSASLQLGFAGTAMEVSP